MLSLFAALADCNVSTDRFIAIRRRHRTRGFTLVEVIVTLTLIAILLALAAPNFRGVIKNHRLSTYANDLISDLNLARSEAITRSSNVGLVCISNNVLCTAGTWETGRFVFVDTNNGNDWDKNDETLRVRPVLDPSITIRSTANLITFDRKGSLIGFTSNVAFTLCDERGLNSGKRVIVSNLTGQARMDNSVPLAGSC